jgi:hypothetical protein
VKEKRHAENSGNNSAIKRKTPEAIAPYCFKPGQSGNPGVRMVLSCRRAGPCSGLIEFPRCNCQN